jgi:hypothetical protein
VTTGAILLAGSGSDGGPQTPAGTRSVDGLLMTVSQTELVLAPLDGSAHIRFPLSPADARRLDLFHLELHSRDRLPSRVYYTQKGGRRTVVRVEDR